MDPLLRAVIDICVLLFIAKPVGILFKKFKLPEGIGFTLAGLLLGPTLIGGSSSEVPNSWWLTTI